jgi:quercetin dioxygenase-like cupin family protein
MPSGSCAEREKLEEYVFGVLSADDDARIRAHMVDCGSCREETKTLEHTASYFSTWPGPELTPANALWSRLANRIGTEGWSGADEELSLAPGWPEADWQETAPGIYTKILAADAERDRVSMLVRLDPGVDYPPHVHAGVEELHLLDGELWINDRKLHPGDCNRAEPGTMDHRVWSETGCTCVLITSPADTLRESVK